MPKKHKKHSRIKKSPTGQESGFTQAPAFYQKSGAGFTLIELMVVISIITLLASIFLASAVSARQAARDAKRLADFSVLTQALELYYNDFNQYPTIPAPPLNLSICITSMGDTDCHSSPRGSTWTPGEGLNALVTNGNLTQLPVDPLNAGIEYYQYKATVDGQSYVLAANLEKGLQQKIIAYGPQANLLLADVNNDNLITSSDMLFVNICRQWVIAALCPYPADLNGDGIVDLTDLNIVRGEIGYVVSP